MDNWINFSKIPDDWDLIFVCFDEESLLHASKHNVLTGFVNGGSWIGTMWVARVVYIQKLLRQYSTIVVSDIDAIWTGNPLADLDGEFGADFIFSQGTIFPQDVYEKTKTVLCCGWFALRRSETTICVLESVLKDMSQTFDDQVSFNRVFDRLGMKWDQLKMTMLQHDGLELHVTVEPQLQILTNGCSLQLVPMQDIDRLTRENAKARVRHPMSPKDVLGKISLLKSLNLWHPSSGKNS
jgi:hypothetical protein